ncbi:hypothetical protein ACFU99_26785 [Streptomyces sp. NPDC057654]|uniref:hypothetical protein n=1 Tax=Streptomyces sp. NPDC057654 TaxID=3346196 RepID=UPI0036CD977A
MDQSKEVHEVRVSARGERASIDIDGRPVGEQVAAYRIDQTAGEPPQVLVHLAAGHSEVEWAGAARVCVAGPPDPGPAAAQFLAAIDPVELETAALARLDLDSGPHALTRAMLAQLEEWASGA